MSSSSSSSSSSKDSKSKLAEEHNEVCEVCEKGGDLLCCDSCTLVFHVQCIRPKLSAVPKGRWSCAHCVADGMGPGDEIAARKAVVSTLNGTMITFNYVIRNHNVLTNYFSRHSPYLPTNHR